MPPDVAWFAAALQRPDRNPAVLRQLAGLSRAELLGDPIPLGSAERYLQVCIEICLDIVRHIIAAENWRAPGNYADAFLVLVEGSVVPQAFAPTLQRMARFRNRLVHWDVESEAIYEILQTGLDDSEQFKSYALACLSRRGVV